MEFTFAFSLISLLSAAYLCHIANTTTHPNIDFIRTSCASTLFPDRCFKYLSPFADKINKNPALLTRVAITVSLSWANHFVMHLNNISDMSVGSTKISEVLIDCVSQFDDAVDQIGDSLRQMEQLSSNRKKFRFDLSNVQTWMSSALTNEDTCMVGFNEVSNSDVKIDVTSRVADVKEVTSNALALVNNYVSLFEEV